MNDATLTSTLQIKLRKYRVSDSSTWINTLIPRISFERSDSINHQRYSLSQQITSSSTLEHEINLSHLGLSDGVGCACIETIQAALTASSSSSSSTTSPGNKHRRRNASSSPSRSKTDRGSTMWNNNNNNNSPSRNNTSSGRGIGISSLNLSSYFVTLRLNKNNLTGAICPCVVALLGATSRIRSLDLTDNNLSAEAVQTLTNTVHSLVLRPNLFVDSVSMLMSKEAIITTGQSPSSSSNRRLQLHQNNNNNNNNNYYNHHNNTSGGGGGDYYDEVININDVSNISSVPSSSRQQQTHYQHPQIISTSPGPRIVVANNNNNRHHQHQNESGISSSSAGAAPQIDLRAMRAQRDALFATDDFLMTNSNNNATDNNNDSSMSSSPAHLKVTKSGTKNSKQNNNNNNLTNVTYNTHSRGPGGVNSNHDNTVPTTSTREYLTAHYDLSPPPLNRSHQSNNNKIISTNNNSDVAPPPEGSPITNTATSTQQQHHLSPLPASRVPQIQTSNPSPPRRSTSAEQVEQARSNSYADIHHHANNTTSRSPSTRTQTQTQQQSSHQSPSPPSRVAAAAHEQKAEIIHDDIENNDIDDASPPSAHVSIERVDTVPNHPSRPSSTNRQRQQQQPQQQSKDDRIVNGSYADRSSTQRRRLHNHRNQHHNNSTAAVVDYPRHQHPATGATLPDMVNPDELVMTSSKSNNNNHNNNNINSSTSSMMSPQNEDQRNINSSSAAAEIQQQQHFGDVLDFLDVSIGMPHRKTQQQQQNRNEDGETEDEDYDEEEPPSSSDDDLLHHGGRKNNNRHWLRAKSLTLLSESNRSGMFRNLTLLELIGLRLQELPPNLPPGLLRLDISRNEITSLRDIVDSCPHLQVLNARRNKLTMVGHHTFLKCPELTHIFLGRNKIPFVEGVGHLLKLETLDLSYNAISSELDIRPLSLNTGLKHLFLEGNPMATKLMSMRNNNISTLSNSTTSNQHQQRYRLTVRKFCPNLLSLDNIVLPVTRQAVMIHQNHQKSNNSYYSSSSPSAAAGSANTATFSRPSSTRKIRPEELFDRDRGGVNENQKNVLHHQRTASSSSSSFAAAAAPKKLADVTFDNTNNNQMNSSSLSSTSPIPRDQAPRPWSASRQRTSSASRRSNTPVQQQRRQQQQHAQYSTARSSSRNNQTYASSSSSAIRQQRTTAGRENASDSVETRYRSPSKLRHPTLKAGNNQNNTRPVLKSPPAKSDAEYDDNDQDQEQEQVQYIDDNDETNNNNDIDLSAISNNNQNNERQDAYYQNDDRHNNNNNNHSTSNSRSRRSNNNTNHELDDSDSHNNNTSTSYIDAEEDNLPQEVQTFSDQLHNDLDAASVALRTYISVLGSNKHSSSSPEGKQCVGVVKRSGLLLDTVLPKKVVKYFHWTGEELNVAPNAPEDTSIVDSIHAGDISGVSDLGASMRQKLLKQIHRLNDAKTCLRYITSLAEAGPAQEGLLKVFIKRVGKTIQQS